MYISEIQPEARNLMYGLSFALIPTQPDLQPCELLIQLMVWRYDVKHWYVIPKVINLN